MLTCVSNTVPGTSHKFSLILITTRSNRSYHYLRSTDEETKARCLAGSPMFVMGLGLERAAPELVLSTTM